MVMQSRDQYREGYDDRLTPRIAAATDAVNKQQKVVDRATAARDAVFRTSLDAQNKSLPVLEGYVPGTW